MSLQKIKEIVGNNGTESEIKDVLKNDPKILGQFFSPFQIRNEFIVFSEFPLAQQIADFAIFTSRSRMEVIIVEIKGADFNLLNKDGNISAFANEDIQAMRHHFRTIETDERYYRQRFHKIRIDVECGKNIYNSSIGTPTGLHVDANKDIVVKGVFIGGRTTDDLTESGVRHELESSERRLKIESWDSWLRKAIE